MHRYDTRMSVGEKIGAVAGVLCAIPGIIIAGAIYHTMYGIVTLNSKLEERRQKFNRLERTSSALADSDLDDSGQIYR